MQRLDAARDAWLALSGQSYFLLVPRRVAGDRIASHRNGRGALYAPLDGDGRPGDFERSAMPPDGAPGALTAARATCHGPRRG
ncbi:hypothetical protein [Falsiroseomonas sp. HW251]|uniref:hypothetical protein n=1 Tax=Falsiroseomonas sp. HW251 TaxID=3390998 RepID=UPI003D312E26